MRRKNGAGGHSHELGGDTVGRESFHNDDYTGGDFSRRATSATGSRRDAINAAADAMFEEDFAGKILPFSSFAADAYAEIAVARRRSGRPIFRFDVQIAAIAKSTEAG